MNEQKPIEVHRRRADRRQTEMKSIDEEGDIDEERSRRGSIDARVRPRRANIEKKEKDQQACFPRKNLRVGQSEQQKMSKREEQRREMNNREIALLAKEQRRQANNHRETKTKPMTRPDDGQHELKRQVGEKIFPHRSTRDDERDLFPELTNQRG